MSVTFRLLKQSNHSEFCFNQLVISLQLDFIYTKSTPAEDPDMSVCSLDFFLSSCKR